MLCIVFHITDVFIDLSEIILLHVQNYLEVTCFDWLQSQIFHFRVWSQVNILLGVVTPRFFFNRPTFVAPGIEIIPVNILYDIPHSG